MTTAFDPWADDTPVDGASGEATDTDLLAIEFDDPLKAQEALLASMRLHKRRTIRIEDAAIVTKDERGKIRIHQTKDVNTGQGAATGGWFGVLAGLLFMAPLVGAVLGAAVGGIWAKLRDIGISDSQMKSMGEDLAEGDAALFVLLEVLAPTNLFRELRRFDGTILFTTMDDDLRGGVAEALAELV
ncbi:MAG: DUF1269 domain-containing protein [Acidimicrobiia bacterium]|nr:DUF1269 domain-containing protein [Acidimicrobiia bacterium]